MAPISEQLPAALPVCCVGFSAEASAVVIAETVMGSMSLTSERRKESRGRGVKPRRQGALGLWLDSWGSIGGRHVPAHLR
ncbi:hypothetical protein HPP92_013440 [Vanilla planifolia]|uniref:Uncharacterized protein n=1 Tax=Vanilla planifolia TaxID=51239 RepID=A0A835V0M1_VANPL|nr:hypothetical protein HPP92_013440 [Vanilla planifolia]